MSVIKLQADFTGWIDNRGFNYALSNPLTSTGKLSTSNADYTYNSFYLFEIPELNGEIVSASLHLSLVHYSSNDEFEGFDVYDVVSSRSEIESNHTFPNFSPELFADLQSGNYYGSGEVSSGRIGSDIEVLLNDQAVTEIEESSDNYMAFGFSASDLSRDFRQIFGFNSSLDAGYQELWITTTQVPEPLPLLLFVPGLIGILLLNKFRCANRVVESL